jgi:ribosomal protein S27E
MYAGSRKRADNKHKKNERAEYFLALLLKQSVSANKMGNVQSGDQDMVARVEMPDHGVFSNTKDGLPAAGGSGGDALASSCCPICYEEFQDIHDKDDGKDDGGEVRDVETSGANVPEVGIHRKMTLTCLHAFCWDCLGQHLETSIENKQVPLSCPMLDCDVPMSIDDVDTLFLSTTDTSNLKSKYEKLVTIKENPVLVECTRCNILLDAKDTSTNEITCDICGHAFCKEHGGIHSSMTCEAFMNTEMGKKTPRVRSRDSAVHQEMHSLWSLTSKDPWVRLRRVW